MPKEHHDAVISLRLTPEERKKLEKLAALEFVPKAFILRAGLRELYARKFPKEKVKR
jgi:hypothetical protein